MLSRVLQFDRRQESEVRPETRFSGGISGVPLCRNSPPVMFSLTGGGQHTTAEQGLAGRRAWIGSPVQGRFCRWLRTSLDTTTNRREISAWMHPARPPRGPR